MSSIGKQGGSARMPTKERPGRMRMTTTPINRGEKPQITAAKFVRPATIKSA
jgi:hypothetical protein